MENATSKERGLLRTLLPALALVAIAVALITVVYGLDNIAPGVHDAFHDFRHVTGFPCH